MRDDGVSEKGFERYIDLVIAFDEFAFLANASGDIEVGRFWSDVATVLRNKTGEEIPILHSRLRHNGPALRNHLDQMMSSMPAKQRHEYLDEMLTATRAGHELGAIPLKQAATITAIINALKKSLGDKATEESDASHKQRQILYARYLRDQAKRDKKRHQYIIRRIK